jgi:cyclophilin family peptidyl-prolyl cis-trans isomerase
VPPLVDALIRVTKEGKETSRDTRVALLDAIWVHGERSDAGSLAPLLKDFDVKVADAASAIMSRWTGRTIEAEPRRPVRGEPMYAGNLNQCVAVALRAGRTFRLKMQPEDAPLTVSHFLKLGTKDRYYDGLTFHRVVPGFVIQGGSPGANEYAGQSAFMRDEISTATHLRGTVGVSTRGRNTGDAQFFVNLVDNPRLDYDYTIFARVVPADMPVIDAIEEGDAIGSMRVVSCAGGG